MPSGSKLQHVLRATVCVALALSLQTAAQKVWQPAPGHTQVPLWPGAAPDPAPTGGPERLTGVETVERVSTPTLTVYAPKANNTGVAMLVFPGGGYHDLAIDLEGTEVCDWLVSRGITCALLKYRVPAPRSRPYWGAYPESPIALEDAQRAIRIVRSRASALHIDPNRIGVLGFSAGGHLVAAVSVHFRDRIYKRIDAVDDVSCRPDFAVALYPGHLHLVPGTLQLNPDIASHITHDVPPTFLLQNENDDVDSIWDSLTYYAALWKAQVPVEFHSYAEGGHAFGLRPTKYPATKWPVLVETWLHTIGMLKP